MNFDFFNTYKKYISESTLYKLNSFFGGEVSLKRKIGEGSYGCLFYPAFPCEGHDESEYINLVSKVLTKEEAENEFKMGEILKQNDILVSGNAGQLNAKYKYGVYALDNCHFPLEQPLEVSTFLKPIQGKECKGRPDKPNLQGNIYDYVVHMEMAQGDVYSAFEKDRILRDPDVSLLDWINSLENVLDGLHTMHTNHIYHFDLNSKNVLYFGNKIKPETCKLIDFGLTIQINTPSFSEFYSQYNNNWNQLPFMFQISHLYYLQGVNVIFYSQLYKEKQKESALKKGLEIDYDWVERFEKFPDLVEGINYYISKQGDMFTDKVSHTYNYTKLKLSANESFDKIPEEERKKLDRAKTMQCLINGSYNWYDFKGNLWDLAEQADLFGFILLFDEFYSLKLTFLNDILDQMFIHALLYKSNFLKLKEYINLMKFSVIEYLKNYDYFKNKFKK
jgi:serine/threonine protein kinase